MYKIIIEAINDVFFGVKVSPLHFAKRFALSIWNFDEFTWRNFVDPCELATLESLDPHAWYYLKHL